MSINEIIKKYLPVRKQKLAYSNNKYNHCSAFSYQNCSNCKEIKRIKCCKKLVYQSVMQVSAIRWQLFFLCLNSHLVIRWVDFNDGLIIAGQVKN